MIDRAMELGIWKTWKAPSAEELEFMIRHSNMETPKPDTISEYVFNLELQELKRKSFKPYYLSGHIQTI